MDWKRPMLRCLLGLKWVFESFVRFVGPIFVVVASALISLVAWVHFYNNVPFYTSYSSFSGIIHLVWGAYIAFCIGYNYFAAVVTPAGTPPEQMKPTAPSTQKWCKKCNRPKPERTHHCHVCGKCVLKMDHHCPWIANCVGFKNHHYFVLFIFWLWLGSAYVAVMGFLPFQLSSQHHIPYKAFVSRGAVIFSFIISIAVFVALTLMLVWQSYLVLTAQTTIEFYYNRTRISAAHKQGKHWRNPFDLGVGNNFQIFFGTRESKFWFSWLLPWGVVLPGDGTSFPTISNQVEPVVV